MVSPLEPATAEIPTHKCQAWCRFYSTHGEYHMPFVSFLLIALPSLLYDCTLIPWYFKGTSAALGAVLCAISAVFQLLTLGFFIGTAFSDPGVIPRGQNPFDNYDVTSDRFRTSDPPKHQEIFSRGHAFRLKYCNRCYIYRTPRAVHCFVCDHCVDRFDHHCPWVGNCIGSRNYRRFYGFISSLSLLVLFVLATCLAKLGLIFADPTTKSNSVLDIFGVLWPMVWDAFVLAVFTLIAVWFVLGLWAYHSYLTCKNQTTYEQIKNYYEERYNPFDKGVKSNVKNILCVRPRPRLTKPLFQETEMRIFEPRDTLQHLPASTPPAISSPVLLPRRSVGGDQLELEDDTSANVSTASVCGIELCSVPSSYIDRDKCREECVSKEQHLPPILPEIASHV